MEFGAPWQSYSPWLHWGQDGHNKYLIEKSLQRTRALNFLWYTHNLQALLGAGNISPKKLYFRMPVVKHLIISILWSSLHLRLPVHAAGHRYNRSELCHGNREVTLGPFSAPMRRASFGRDPQEAFLVRYTNSSFLNSSYSKPSHCKDSPGEHMAAFQYQHALLEVKELYQVAGAFLIY